MGGSKGGNATGAWGKPGGAPNGPRERPPSPPRAPLWLSGLQKFEEICLGSEAAVDWIRLVVLALFASQMREPR